MSDPNATAARQETDYASVTVSIDHLLAEPHNGHTVVKCVFSTESAVEALLAQLSYFGMFHELNSSHLRRVTVEAEDRAAVFVVRGRDNLTNVIVDAAVLGDLMDPTSALGGASNPAGTLAGAHGALIALATDLLRTAAQQTGVPQNVVAWLSSDGEVAPISNAA